MIVKKYYIKIRYRGKRKDVISFTDYESRADYIEKLQRDRDAYHYKIWYQLDLVL